MKPEARVLGVGGSPRKGGNSDGLLKRILRGVEAEGVPAKPVQLREHLFQSCVGCERCRRDKRCTGLLDGMQLLYPALVQARGLVLVSPVHTFYVSAWMKAFIDRLYAFYDFTDDRPLRYSSRLADQGRKAVVCAVCEQTNAADMGFALEGMRRSVEYLGYEVVGELPVFGLFERGAVAKEEAVLLQAEACGRELARSL